MDFREAEWCVKINGGLRVHLEGWDREGGREMQEGGEMRIYVYV